LLLSLAPLIWGFGFIGTRWALEAYSGTWCHAIRFLICLPFVVPYLLYKKTFFNKDYLKTGFVLGFVLSLGLWLQTIGIDYTSVAKAGFFTVFYAFFTPIIAMLLWKRTYKKLYWILVAFALLGIGLLCELKIDNFNKGDLIIIISAVIFSVQIVMVESSTEKDLNPIELNFMQTFAIAIFSFITALPIEKMPSFEPLFDISSIFRPSPLSGMIIISIFSTLVAFTLQLVAQKNIKSHIASMIFLLEAISAAFFGYLFLGETLSLMSTIGAVVVLASVSLVPLTFSPE
jgi:drug/metabolite transporter (DMT)-like permease